MANDALELGVMATVWCEGLGEMDIDPNDFDKIEAEWTRYIDSGKTIDKIVHAEAPSGTRFVFTVSRLQSMLINTRAQRATGRELSQAWDRERKADGIID